jgi:hypothetical protein
MRYNNYYLQRIPAHIVFAVFTTITYKLIKDQEEKQLAGKRDTADLAAG